LRFNLLLVVHFLLQRGSQPVDGLDDVLDFSGLIGGVNARGQVVFERLKSALDFPDATLQVANHQQRQKDAREGGGSQARCNQISAKAVGSRKIRDAFDGQRSATESPWWMGMALIRKSRVVADDGFRSFLHQLLYSSQFENGLMFGVGIPYFPH
jgi:hypothetical protein